MKINENLGEKIMSLFDKLFGTHKERETVENKAVAKPSIPIQTNQPEYDFATSDLSQHVTCGKNRVGEMLNKPTENNHKVEEKTESFSVQYEDCFEEMIDRTRFGDTYAMHQLAIWFRNKLSSEYLSIEAMWESAPKEGQDSLAKYIKANPEEFVNARAGIMWHIRAALYGEQASEEYIECHSALKALSLLSENMLIPGTRCRDGEAGSMLRSIGLIDFSEDQHYSISSLSEEGFFIATTDGGYEGPDEDGFGMEELYNYYCFDEFFCLLGKRLEYSHRDYESCEKDFMKQCSEKQADFQTQRENYWASSHLPKEARRYNELMTQRNAPVILGETLVHYFGVQSEYVIPSNVKTIGAKAFTGNTSITSIIVPEQVSKIEYGAFSGCPELEKLVLPDHLEVLGEALCSDSRKLKQVHLPQLLRAIPSKMFQFNKGLKTIDLPPNLQEIGDSAFLYTEIQSIELPKSVVAIGASAFYGSHIYSVYIYENVTLGEDVFKFCDSLEEAYIEDGITRIPKGCFSCCKSLKKVRLPETATRIDNYAFGTNNELTTLRIPASVTEIWCSGRDFGNVILQGVAGSFAEEFAKKWRLTFQPDL